ncbi:MAG: metallophosphoesterase [Gemmatimonadota bacterium]|nr:metallophosphoesterase [Gemmatimonadota bacterium]
MTGAAPAPADPEARRQRRPRFSRVLLVLLVWMGTCWSVIGSLLAPVVPGGWMIVVGLAVLSVLPVWVLARGFGGRAYPGAATRLWVLRPFWYAQLFLPLLAIAGLLGAVAGWPFGMAGTVGRGVLLACGAVFVFVAVLGWVGTRRLVVKRLTATFPDLPSGLDGLRIVQISDTHVGPHSSRRHLARVARMVENESPELIAVTGDLVDDFPPDVDHYAAALGGLSAPLGVFVVPGNHDVYAGWQQVRRRLEALPVTVLVNEAQTLGRGGARFTVIGTGDPAGAYWQREGGGSAAPDVDRALAMVPPGTFTLALAHDPVLWPQLAQCGVHLTLSGHTHWGQFALPALNWSIASPFLEHSMGTYRQGDSLLYIHPGTNFWGIPFRIGALPQVAVITLRRAASTEIKVCSRS